MLISLGFKRTEGGRVSPQMDTVIPIVYGDENRRNHSGCEDLGGLQSGGAITEDSVGGEDRGMGEVIKGLEDFGGIWTSQLIGIVLEGLNPFGFFTERDAGGFEKEGFFLETAGVCEESFGMIEEHQHVEVANGMDLNNIRVILVEFIDLLFGPWVNREENG